MIFGKDSDEPASILAAQEMHLTMVSQGEQRRASVTDLVTFLLCSRYAHQFSREHFPAQTPATVLGHILHRTIKHLYDRYQIQRQAGNISWLPEEELVQDEYRVAEEAARAQGLPRLSQRQRTQLQQMLVQFHRLEAATFYPRVQAAEANVGWVWEKAPGGPLLLEGKVDVVVQDQKNTPGIILWDYKTTKRPDAGKEMQYYQWQMDLYTLLYQRTYGIRPQGTVLYFMGELDRAHLTQRPRTAIAYQSIDDQHEQHTLDLLRWVIEQEQLCSENNQWKPPAPEQIPQRLCRHCLIRWSCPSVRFPFPWEASNEQTPEIEEYDF
ncbi:MAG TPA: PD-(D/E)XK nuclease family protein [Ktedonobacteraceae bacterium]|nr:PD-(D/E)XK nuclease family protein [Ktedonobacteraceae bacterium]